MSNLRTYYGSNATSDDTLNWVAIGEQYKISLVENNHFNQNEVDFNQRGQIKGVRVN